jgi:hypothetical protein
MVKVPYDIELAFRPLNILCKILGLGHFTVHRNPFTGELKYEDNRNSAFRDIIWCVLVICTIFAGFVINTTSVLFSSPSSVFEVVAFIISMPVAYLETSLALLAGITFNRNKFTEFVGKISEIDEDLLGSKRVYAYGKQYSSLIRQLVILSFVLIPFYCYDSYIFGDKGKYLYGYIHVSNFIKQIVIMQYVNVIWIVTERLQYLNGELAKSLDLPTDIVNKTRTVGSTVCIGTSKRQKQMPPLQVNISEDSGILVADLPVFRATRSSASEVGSLLKLRRLYNLMFHASRLINEMYGMHILLELTYNFINVVVSVYGIFGIMMGSLKLNPTLSALHYVVVYVCWILVSLLNVFMISASCHKASAEVERCSQEIQNLLIVDPLRQDLRHQLKYFAQQVSNTGIVFTAFDVFTINLSIIFTFLSSATTYIIVLVQLK